MIPDPGTGAMDPGILRRKIFRIDRLSAMPQVVMELLEAVENDITGAKKLERIIESDQALSSRVLGLANSAYYGCSQTITTIRRAVVVIGFDELRILAIGSGLSDMLDLVKRGPLCDGRELWAHCLAVSWLARALAEEVGHEKPGEVMIAGLLHDVGKLILLSRLEDESEKLADLIKGGLKYYQAEDRLGLDHAKIGYWLTKKWGLPEIHICSIRYHHKPFQDRFHFQTTNLVCLADLMAKRLNFGLSQESEPIEMEEVIRAAGLKPGQLNDVVVKSGHRIPQLLDSWNLSG